MMLYRTQVTEVKTQGTGKVFGCHCPSEDGEMSSDLSRHEACESVPIAECAQNSRIPRTEQRRQRFALSVARRESAALGPNRVPIGNDRSQCCTACASLSAGWGDLALPVPSFCPKFFRAGADCTGRHPTWLRLNPTWSTGNVIASRETEW